MIEIEERIGYCKKCRSRTLLADGLCLDCWDGNKKPVCPNCGSKVKLDLKDEYKTMYKCTKKGCYKRVSVYNGKRVKYFEAESAVIARFIELNKVNVNYRFIREIIALEFGIIFCLSTFSHWKKTFIKRWE